MGAPVLSPASIPVNASDNLRIPVEVDGRTIEITAVSMGNPHGVVFVDNLDTIDIPALGPVLEKHPMWPDRANIEFAQVLSPHEIRMRVWERGSGETRHAAPEPAQRRWLHLCSVLPGTTISPSISSEATCAYR